MPSPETSFLEPTWEDESIYSSNEPHRLAVHKLFIGKLTNLFCFIEAPPKYSMPVTIFPVIVTGLDLPSSQVTLQPDPQTSPMISEHTYELDANRHIKISALWAVPVHGTLYRPMGMFISDLRHDWDTLFDNLPE